MGERSCDMSSKLSLQALLPLGFNCHITIELLMTTLLREFGIAAP